MAAGVPTRVDRRPYHDDLALGARERCSQAAAGKVFLSASSSTSSWCLRARFARLIEVVVTWFGFRIGIHFNFSDPALNAAIVDPARDASDPVSIVISEQKRATEAARTSVLRQCATDHSQNREGAWSGG